MDTLLTAPALRSDDEASHFIDQVLAQAAPIRAQMQAVDAENARLTSEIRLLHEESGRLFAEQHQAARDMAAALDRLTAQG